MGFVWTSLTVSASQSVLELYYNITLLKALSEFIGVFGTRNLLM